MCSSSSSPVLLCVTPAERSWEICAWSTGALEEALGGNEGEIFLASRYSVMAGFNLFLITRVVSIAAGGIARSNMFCHVSFHSYKTVDCRHKEPGAAQLLWIDEFNFCSGKRTRSKTLSLRDASKKLQRGEKWSVGVTEFLNTGFHAA